MIYAVSGDHSEGELAEPANIRKLLPDNHFRFVHELVTFDLHK